MDIPRIPLIEEPIDGSNTVGSYDRYAAQFMRPEYRRMAIKIRTYGITHGRVLDVGTGSGRLAIELAKLKNNKFEIIGVDISAGMLKQARVNVQSAVAPGISFVQATASQLPFEDESFDVVTSYASFHHWLCPAEAFSEMWRVTKLGGLILVRDNRRMLGQPFYKTCIWVLSRFMSSSQRQMWPKAILASYTLEEAKSILAESDIDQCVVKMDMWGFDLCVESRK